MKIVSGGQTGVDRAALDAAIEAGVPHGGYCPQGRQAEDGTIPLCYQLNETDSEDYAVRTERNVVESDATLIFSRGGALKGGTAKTEAFALAHSKPCLVVDEATSVEEAITRISEFESGFGIEILNVAGPRESEAPDLGDYVREVLRGFLETERQ